jgi:hypothetical protein
MPDQRSASNEHAIMQEVTAPLSTLPENPLPVAADVDFPIVLRGYDRLAVDAYVRKTSQLVAELQSTRSPEAAIRRALERVGEEVTGILQRAHEAAEQITAQSRREAEARLEAARQEAEDIATDAVDRVKELDLETDRIWEERLRIVEDARELARQLLGLADSAAQQFPAEETESTEVVAEPEIAEVFSNAGEEEGAEDELAGEEEEAEAEPPAEEEERPAALADEERPAALADEDAADREDTAIMPAIRPPDADAESH